MNWAPGPRSDPADPIQEAVVLVHDRLEQIRAYHAPVNRVGYDVPGGYSREFDLLQEALARLCRAVDARDAEARQELAPWRELRRAS